MPKRILIRQNAYFDSLFLMQVAHRMEAEGGLHRAAAVIGTPANVQLLIDAGYDAGELVAAGPNDLVIAVDGERSALESALSEPERWFRRVGLGEGQYEPVGLEEALSIRPDASVAVVSVPGEYAAAEARKALSLGLSVFLFSSNVSVEDELSLKRQAREHGLIVMGPDCGTALVGGAGIGFANAVRRGPIGVIGSTGTGMQELICQVHGAGSGISHAIGTGSRDLLDEIGALSTLTALEALEADVETRVIVLLSKPPGAATSRMLMARLSACSKPVVTCLLGSQVKPDGRNAVSAATIDEATALALEAIGSSRMQAPDVLELRGAAHGAASSTRGRYVRGIFAGGTFCYQTQSIFGEGGVVVHSNAPLAGMNKLPDSRQSREHSLVDMGAEEFVEGRPHPMIDATVRCERVLQEGRDPEVALLLLDFILGEIAAADPVGDLLPAIVEARLHASRGGGELCVAASLCGTDLDRQGLGAQVERLAEVGVHVFPSNVQAALFARELVISLRSTERDGNDEAV